MKNKIILLVISLFAGLLISEGITRLVRPASDIFPADPTPDPILGHRLQPYQSGHDKNGFRNQTAAGSFSLVFIGDSMTYGNGVPRDSAIPQKLGKVTGQRVYNMSLGAYGPIQYYQLLKESAAMHPEKTIIAFYLGNDLLDSYSLPERLDYWKWLIKDSGDLSNLPEIKKCPLTIDNHELTYQDPDIITIRMKERGSIIWKVHSFLRLNSALYALQYEGMVKPLIQRYFERQKQLERPGAFYTPLVDTIFMPSFTLGGLNIADEKVQRGMLTTKRVIELIKAYLQEEKRNTQVIFIILPSKENVYYNFLKDHNVSLPPNFECSVYYERKIAKWLQGVIEDNGLQFIDIFPSLELSANNRKLLYHSSSDSHLNALGCRKVARAIYDNLRPKNGGK